MNNLERIEQLSLHLDDALHIAEEFLYQTPYLYMAVERISHRISYLIGDWEKGLGWSYEEMVGKPFTDFLHPDDIKSSILIARQMEAGGFFEKYDHEDLICEADGTICPKKTTVFSNRYRYKLKNGGYKYLHWQSQKKDSYENYLLGIALLGTDYIEGQHNEC